ncbi:MAG: 5,10-methylenetetrahydromethanopterin reductase [Candidatus Hodarchaeales archaeon]|jgi:5,10-methylenetetrahydromethanopterin reductase
MVKFGIEFVPEAPSSQVAYYSGLAERTGFEYVWITDHFNNRNVWVGMTNVSLLTNSIKVGTGVTNPYCVNPVVIASAIASLDELNNYRTILGLGPGDEVTLRNLGVERAKPLRGMRESVDIIRRLWKREEVSYEGKVFNVAKARLAFKVQRMPPIYLAAQGPLMTKLAGEIADGILINASHPKDYEIAKEHIEAGAKKAGRNLDEIDIAAYVSFAVDKKTQKAIDAAKIVVAFIVAGSIPMILDRHGIPKEEADQISGYLSKGKWGEAIGAVTPKMIDTFCVAGTPDEVIEKINSLMGAGVTQLICGSPLGKDIPKAIKLIGKSVMPAFKE